MAENLIRISSLADTGDQRGSSFTVPEAWSRFLSSIHDLHLMTLKPNYVRGNHYHARRREILLILHWDTWSFHWDTGEGTAPELRTFNGSGVVLIEVEPQASHAVVNRGLRDLVIAGMADEAYDPGHPDSHPRKVV